MPRRPQQTGLPRKRMSGRSAQLGVIGRLNYDRHASQPEQLDEERSKCVEMPNVQELSPTEGWRDGCAAAGVTTGRMGSNDLLGSVIFVCVFIV